MTDTVLQAISSAKPPKAGMPVISSRQRYPACDSRLINGKQKQPIST